MEEDTTEHGVSRARQGLEMDQNGNVAVRPGVVQSVKAKMSTRQMAFIGPRQGVLANSTSPPLLAGSVLIECSPLCDPVRVPRRHLSSDDTQRS